jgi:hypothetical protein
MNEESEFEVVRNRRASLSVDTSRLKSRVLEVRTFVFVSRGMNAAFGTWERWMKSPMIEFT